MKQVSILILSAFILFSCSPVAQTPSTEVVNVYATSAAQPWLSELYTCAADASVILVVNAEEPDISLRVGEPEELIFPAYQIDEEELWIVTHRESPVQNLSFEEAQDLFAKGNPLVQVWVYSSGEDLQIAFDQLVMNGRSVTSSARVAVNAQNMSDLLNSESNAVGILPSHWKIGNVREVFSAGKVPVLAITREEPQGIIRELLSCLQSN